MTWLNKPRDIQKYEGFVYIIEDRESDKYYIGKKTFWFKNSKRPLKGKRNRRIEYIESDWKDYWGSSNTLKKDIEKYGTKRFKKSILKCYKTKWECSYYELVEQINREVLFDNNAYNEAIRIRLRKRK